MINVVAVDFDCKLDRKQLADVCMALTIQAQQHFALPPPYGYGIQANVRLAAGPFDVRPHEWVLGLFAKPTGPGELGEHDETPSGQPVAKVFPLLDPSNPWSVTMSHELLEMLADPNIARCSLAEDGQIWAYEVCDACEQQSYGIHVPSGALVQVSDFVLPPYFEPVTNMRGLKRDWMGLIKRPLEILPGGYGQTFDPSNGWSQHQNAEMSAYRVALTVHGEGRGSARRGTVSAKAGP